MAAESNHIPSINHFEGGANVEQGSKSSPGQSGTTLSEFFRRRRSGRFTAGAGGDTTVTFTEPLPDANYTIQITGDAGSIPYIKDGSTPAATGFIITATAAGLVHWTATWDGPST